LCFASNPRNNINLPAAAAATQASKMDHKILFGFLITVLLALSGSVVGDQDEDIPHNEWVKLSAEVTFVVVGRSSIQLRLCRRLKNRRS